MIRSLQSLRGIFAIGVLLSHYDLGGSERVFYPGGAMGVTFFLMLSGFVMSLAYSPSICSDEFNYRDYLSRRVRRIYPLHWIMFFITLVVLYHFHFIYSNWEKLFNFFGLQGWNPFWDFYGVNVPSWYLAPLILFYILFPSIYRVYARNHNSFFIASGMIVISLILYIEFLLPLGNVNITWCVRVCPPVRLVECIIGILLFISYKKINGYGRVSSLSIGWATLIEIGVVALWVIMAYEFENIDVRWQSSVMWWLPAALTIMVFALFDGRGGVVSRVLRWHPLLVLGEASMCLFLMHDTILFIFRRTLRHEGIDFTQPPIIVATIAFCLISALLAHKHIESPLSRRSTLWGVKRIFNF